DRHLCRGETTSSQTGSHGNGRRLEIPRRKRGSRRHALSRIGRCPTRDFIVYITQKNARHSTRRFRTRRALDGKGHRGSVGEKRDYSCVRKRCWFANLLDRAWERSARTDSTIGPRYISKRRSVLAKDPNRL